MFCVRPLRGTACARRLLPTIFVSVLTLFATRSHAQSHAQSSPGGSAVRATHSVTIVVPSFSLLSSAGFVMDTPRARASIVRFQSNNPQLFVTQSDSLVGPSVRVSALNRYEARNDRGVVGGTDRAGALLLPVDTLPARHVYVTVVEQ